MTLGLACEICVLGGGPAGAVIARRLAELRHDTILIQRVSPEIHPRTESLAPSALSILDFLGVRRFIDPAIFLSEHHALIRWHSHKTQAKRFGRTPSVLVDRARFDSLLRKAAAGVGARLIAASRVHSPTRIPSGGWLVSLQAPNEPTSVTARFFVDARGKRRRRRTNFGSPTTAAMSAAWAVRGRSMAETRLEALADAWCWGSPTPSGGYAATVFTDSSRLAGRDRDGIAQLYRGLLSCAKLLGNLVQGDMTQPVCVRDATSGISDELIGMDFIKVGEAAFSIDPLSSQGIQCALVSAVQGSAAVHTILSRADDASAAIEFYPERQQKAAAHASFNATRLYRTAIGSGDHPFWTRRSLSPEGLSAAGQQDTRADVSLPLSLGISPALQIVEVPTMCGNHIIRTKALSHPGLSDPVAYFGTTTLVLLLDLLRNETPTEEIVERWTRHAPPSIAWAIVKWMYANGILVSPRNPPYDPARSRPSGFGISG
jgi:flavin-dependent dehydrogenase